MKLWSYTKTMPSYNIIKCKLSGQDTVVVLVSIGYHQEDSKSKSKSFFFLYPLSVRHRPISLKGIELSTQLSISSTPLWL